MKLRVRLFGALLIAGTVSACGGGGTGTGSSSATFSQLSAQGDALVSNFERRDVTPIADMPTTGSAVYTGVAYHGFSSNPVVIVDNPDALSRVRLTVRSGDGTISGFTDNFRSADQRNNISGSINLVDGKINGNTFSSGMSGRLVENGVVVDYSGNLGGAFAGADASSLVAFAETNASIRDVSQGNVYSVFGAER